MVNRLPNISDKHKICIICEGNEEYKYIERLNQLHVWNDIYDISLVNAEGNGNMYKLKELPLPEREPGQERENIGSLCDVKTNLRYMRSIINGF